MSNGLSWGFFGSGGFAARCLALLAEWRAPSWIVTAPPKYAGRGKALRPTQVGAVSAASFPGIPLILSGRASSDPELLALIKDLPVDFCFVIDFGQMIKEPLLAEGERVGCLNIHPSLLPGYRGAAPVQRALMDCRGSTGVTVFKLASGMDSGPVLLRKEIAIDDDDDAGTLLERTAVAGTSAFIRYASAHPIGQWRFEAQDDSLSTAAPKIRPEEERIDWGRHPSSVCGLIRALAPKPGAWTTFREKRLRVLRARLLPHDASGCHMAESVPGMLEGPQDGGVAVRAGGGAIALLDVQPEGKKTMPAIDWWNGLRAERKELLS
ncbi:MAG: methionyl-tRNA formyltransferase [Synergistaceae bacterium]|nr:methionyl-tRNA formyltransferase [Synergistaceae bacterium]